MLDVISCVTKAHDLRLVLVAVLVCIAGSMVTIQLFDRLCRAGGGSRMGWLALSAISTGTMVWSTHFVAMLAFRAGAPVTLDPVLTLASIAAAILLSAPGLALAASDRRGATAIGGAIIGLAVAAMHYTGMAAYRVDGLVRWNWSYVAASVVLSIMLAGLAFACARRAAFRDRIAAGLILTAAIATLHFTGMAAMKIWVLDLHGGQGLSRAAATAMAIGTAFAALLTIMCGAVSILIDGRTQTESYQRLRQMALHDSLTGLPNRMQFNELLRDRLAALGSGQQLAVVMIDLSRFKSVNDTFGHQAGDELLSALAQRLSASLGAGECIARLGGDEFAALLTVRDRDQLDGALRRLTCAFTTPFEFARFTATIGANIGVALAPADGNGSDVLLARADLAMYRAKSEHSPTPCFYDRTMDEAVREQRELAAQLREAIVTGSFELHYQVQVATDTGEISGYEALIRWRHPVRGIIPPLRFIPLAEEIGEIVPLSEWVLRRACGDAAAWAKPHAVSVNLSPLHLSDPGLVPMVRRALADSGLPPQRLELELTESAIIRDRELALEQLAALRAMGVGLALDDFGKGYSSLDVLRSFTFDRIKLDASFVAELDKDEQAVAILRSVTALGSTLHIPVLAEGVEEPSQLRIVTQEGCSTVQGYLIGRPSPELADPDDVRSMVRSINTGTGSVTLAA